MRIFFSVLDITLVEQMSSAYFNVFLFCLKYFKSSDDIFDIGNVNPERMARATKERYFPPCMFAILAVLLFHKRLMFETGMLL